MLSEGHIRNFGLRVGRVFGIEVWFHWTLLIIVAIRLLNILINANELEPPLEQPLGYWGVNVLALLITLLLHEFGHCYAAYRQGGGAERVVIWPLGGLAYCDAPQFPRSQLWVAAGGPLVNIGLGLLSLVICAFAGWYVFPFGSGEGFLFPRLFFQYLFLWNSFLLILNLLPCYPLDGGRIMQAFLWGRIESYGQATLVTLRISRVIAIAALVVGGIILIMGFTSRTFPYEHPLLNCLGLGFLLMGVLHFYEARALRLRLEYGEEEEGIFGYDFSRGYTSLERTAPKERRPSLVKRLRESSRERAEARKLEREREMRARLDQLLDKIHHESMDSLTREEKRFLDRASKFLRKSEASKDS